VLAAPISSQRLEPIAGRDPQVIEATRDLQLSQLSPRDRLDPFKALDALSLRKGLGIRITKGDDHDTDSNATR